MNYKYTNFHKGLNCNCPREETLNSVELVAFRWVHEDFNHKNNFLPVFLIEPSRLSNYDECDDKCNGFGLSMFNDVKKAENKLKSYLRRKPLLEDVLGTCIATGTLTSDDGKASNISASGHFTFHESNDSQLKSKFTICKKVISGKSI